MYDLEEQDQIDALKSWWKQNGNLVLTVLVAACLAGGGTAGWRWYRSHQAEEAAQLYAGLEKARRSNDAKVIRETAGQLMDRHAFSLFVPVDGHAGLEIGVGFPVFGIVVQKQRLAADKSPQAAADLRKHRPTVAVFGLHSNPGHK